jgi:hypothetical protein
MRMSYEYMDENGDIVVCYDDETEPKEAPRINVNKGDTLQKQTYLDIAEAVKMSGNNRSNLVGIIAAYEVITGSSINKSTLRRKLERLDRVLAQF